jgi:hypothetical protein
LWVATKLLSWLTWLWKLWLIRHVAPLVDS